MKPLIFSRPLKAAVLSCVVIGCGAPAQSALPPVEVDVPVAAPSGAAVPPVSAAQAPARKKERELAPETFPSEMPVPTKMTILLSGDAMFAYVSVPSEGAWKDLEGANSDFYYDSGRGWTPVPGCQSVLECDVSSVRIGNTRFKAVFSPQSGIYAGAEGTFP